MSAPPGGGRGRGRGKRKAQQLARLAEPKPPARLPASALFTKLAAFERRADAALARKKAEANETMTRVEREPRVVRMYVYNTFKPAAEEPASWTLHVQGRLLTRAEADESRSGSAAAAAAAAPEPTARFGAFVRRVEVHLDPAQFPGEEGVVTWDADECPPDRPARDVDGFEVKRRGDVDARARIVVELDHGGPAKVAIAPAMAEVLGVDIDTRPRAIRALWRYVEAHELLDPDDPGRVRCDARLRTLFAPEIDAERARLAREDPESESNAATNENNAAGATDAAVAPATTTPPIPFASMAEGLVSRHATREKALAVDYVVRTRGRKNPTNPDCYDVLVDVPTELLGAGRGGGGNGNASASAAGGVASVRHHAYIERLGRERDVESCDARIRAGIAKISEHATRRAFLLGFAADPAGFVDAVVQAQARDAVLGARADDGGATRLAERGKELYEKAWVDEAVMRYVAKAGKQSQAGGGKKPKRLGT